jgi:hypothetical protein
VNLWTRVVEQLNGPYWKRRGFEVLDVIDCPKGMWLAVDDFRLLMMRKTLETSDAETVKDLTI